MTNRPYVLLSCAMSIDGYIDDTSSDRLILSNSEDLDRVDEVRAGCDAILIGASTMRKDNPRLLVNSPDRRADREARGLPPYPLKVTVTATGDLDPSLKFWHYGGAKLVYCPESAADKVRYRLGDLAEVCSLVRLSTSRGCSMTSALVAYTGLWWKVAARSTRSSCKPMSLTRFISPSPRSSSETQAPRDSLIPEFSLTARCAECTWRKSR